MRGGDRAGTERLGENVGGGDRILHRKIDANAADRPSMENGFIESNPPEVQIEISPPLGASGFT